MIFINKNNEHAKTALINKYDKCGYSSVKKIVYQKAIYYALHLLIDETDLSIIQKKLQCRHKNNNYTGKKREIYQEGLSDAIDILKTVKTSAVPPSWYGHNFNETEIKTLERGGHVKLERCVSENGYQFSCTISFGRLKDGRKGIIANI